MEKFNSTAQAAQSGEQAGAVATQENPTEAAGQERIVGAHREDFRMIDPDVGEDGAGGEPADPDGAGQDGDQAEDARQTRKENAAIRAARLRARREAEAAAAQAADEEIANSGVLNPYTGKPFTSMAEFRAYGEKVRKAELTRKAQAAGKSVDELSEDEANRKFLSELRKAEAKKAEAAASEKAKKDFLMQDALDFVERYPNVDISKLEQNRQFRQFCGSRFGREPLAQLYEDFLEIIGGAGNAAAAKAGSKAARSTGSGTAGGAALTAAQKSALDAWNAEHPEMAMTAKEFLGR